MKNLIQPLIETRGVPHYCRNGFGPHPVRWGVNAWERCTKCGHKVNSLFHLVRVTGEV